MWHVSKSELCSWAVYIYREGHFYNLLNSSNEKKNHLVPDVWRHLVLKTQTTTIRTWVLKTLKFFFVKVVLNLQQLKLMWKAWVQSNQIPAGNRTEASSRCMNIERTLKCTGRVREECTGPLIFVAGSFSSSLLGISRTLQRGPEPGCFVSTVGLAGLYTETLGNKHRKWPAFVTKESLRVLIAVHYQPRILLTPLWDWNTPSLFISSPNRQQHSNEPSWNI